MREIKFRAFGTGGMRMVETISFVDEKALLNDGDDVPLINLTLMQYTGLDDRDGNEIYECDLVKRVAGDMESPTFYEVVWVNHGFHMWNEDRIPLSLDEGKGKHTVSLLVVGNKYEGIKSPQCGGGA